MTTFQKSIRSLLWLLVLFALASLINTSVPDVFLLRHSDTLFLLALTNGHHQLVFRFRPEFVSWDTDYTPGPLFFTVYLWLVLLLAAAKRKPNRLYRAQPTATTKSLPAAESGTEGSHANGDGSYRFLYSYDNREVTLYTPENVVSEGTGIYDPDYVPKDNIFEEMSLTFEAKDNNWVCQARDYQSYTTTFLEHLAQFYFNGELDFTINGKVDEDAVREISDSSQTATDLGFKWLGRPVQLIVSSYLIDSGMEWTHTFVGVEYDNKSAPDGGMGLVGTNFFHDDMLTRDQLAYIDGQIFGVDSGVKGNPFAESGTESQPAAAIDASAILGTWTDSASTWGTSFTFRSDGSGVRFYTETGENDPFTYQEEVDQVKLHYENGDDDAFTVEADGSSLKLTDNFGNVAEYREAEKLPFKLLPPGTALPIPLWQANGWMKKPGTMKALPLTKMVPAFIPGRMRLTPSNTTFTIMVKPSSSAMKMATRALLPWPLTATS